MLMAILGELPLSEGTITVRGKVGYASQQAWIYNGSLQQNIIFGSEYNESKYQEVIKACALERVRTGIFFITICNLTNWFFLFV